MRRIKQKPLGNTRPFPLFQRRGLLGLVIVTLTIILLCLQLFFGQFMRVASNSMTPSVVSGDVLFVTYSDPSPGDIVVVDDGQYRVLRRLTGVAGDDVEITPHGLVRNEKLLKPNGLMADWRSVPELLSSQKQIPNKTRARLRRNRLIQVPPSFVHVSCDLARFCRKSPIHGLVPTEHIYGHVIFQWPERTNTADQTQSPQE
ncbi:MAG: signal peptidase I [Bradymonadia bacterium]